jgi:hypothetical protein
LAENPALSYPGVELGCRPKRLVLYNNLSAADITITEDLTANSEIPTLNNTVARS